MIWGIWTLVALFFTSQLYFSDIYTEHPISFSTALFMEVTFCYLWALVTPLVIWLARRFRIERQHWLRNGLIHLLLSTALIAVITSIFYTFYTIHLKGLRSFSTIYMFRMILWNLDRDMAIYWLIILMSHAFNYYNRYRKGELKASQLESLLAQSQLQALKMQLQPHFLFNTLHSIAALLNKDTEAARKMIALLGDFLRLTLENSGTQEVTLQEEIEFLKGYLEIERIRFQDRLTTHVEVEPQALNAQVPNLILQPIVENAIRHGIATRSTPGLIEIKAAERGGMLRIQVRDNGPGLTMDQDLMTKSKEGLGLTNTRARLEQLYGSAQHFEMTNDPEGGLIVTLEIPSGTEVAATKPATHA